MTPSYLAKRAPNLSEQKLQEQRASQRDRYHDNVTEDWLIAHNKKAREKKQQTKEDIANGILEPPAKKKRKERTKEEKRADALYAANRRKRTPEQVQADEEAKGLKARERAAKEAKLGL